MQQKRVVPTGDQACGYSFPAALVSAFPDREGQEQFENYKCTASSEFGTAGGDSKTTAGAGRADGHASFRLHFFRRPDADGDGRAGEGAPRAAGRRGVCGGGEGDGLRRRRRRTHACKSARGPRRRCCGRRSTSWSLSLRTRHGMPPSGSAWGWRSAAAPACSGSRSPACPSTRAPPLPSSSPSAPGCSPSCASSSSHRSPTLATRGATRWLRRWGAEQCQRSRSS